MKEREIRTKENKLLAITFPASLFVDGIRFLTPTEFPLQVGLIQSKNEPREVKAHIHRNFKYDVSTTQELIYVIKGGARAIIYDDNFKEVDVIELKKGDFMLQVSGGHSFDIEEGSRLLEVKQGPYPGDKEAKVYKDN